MKKINFITVFILMALATTIIYSCQKELTWPSVSPATALATLTTSITSGITDSSAVSGGSITIDGGTAVTARGVCWSTHTNPTVADNKTTDGTGTGNFTSNLSGLIKDTVYYVRAYATNTTGTAYGNQQSFTAGGSAAVTVPVLTTNAATAITETTANSGGNITSTGGAAITARGVCWSTSVAPTIALATKTSDGSGAGIFTSNITGLTANTVYYVRAYATNSAGTAYGNQETFTAGGSSVITIPVIITSAASGITQTTANSGGNITGTGGANITARGICWSTSVDPTIALATKTSDGTGAGFFTSAISGLAANTTYYLRAYAVNSAGTGYGNQETFTTIDVPGSTGTLTDIDGNIYPSITICSQVWMAKNLNTSRYRNGDAIPEVQDTAVWRTTTTGAWCYYANTTANGTTYGKLYNWYAVNDPRGLAPAGWHVASDAEWTTVGNCLGGELTAGGKMKTTGTKQAGTGLWEDPNTGATNSSGFAGQPGGFRYGSGTYYYIGKSASFWTSTEYDGSNAQYRDLVWNDISMFAGTFSFSLKDYGNAVRCVKD